MRWVDAPPLGSVSCVCKFVHTLWEPQAVSSPMLISGRFYPRSPDERREWIAARQKERLSRYPSYANYSDLAYHLIAPIGSDKWLTMPVLDPTCLLLPTPKEWYGREGS